MDDNQHLANSRLFRDLELSQLAALFEISNMEMFDAGDVIFREGEVGECLYVVMDGSVRISLSTPGEGEEALAILAAGESFGEMAAIERGEAIRSATAVAHESCSLLTIDKFELQTLLAARHDIAFVVLQNVVRHLSDQLRSTNRKILFLSAAGMFS